MRVEATAPRVRTHDYATARHLQQQRASTRASRGPVLLAVAYSPRAGSGGVGQGLAPSRPAAAAPRSLTAYLEVLLL
eukprot:COSAG01_NODE_251_length_20305_cov_5.846447_4_plen_77_part_00